MNLYTDLMEHIRYARPDEAIAILRKNPQLINANLYPGHSNASRYFAILGAAAQGNERLLEFLIKENANLKQRGSLGATALHRAAEWGNVDAIGILVDAGADIEAVDDRDMTPIDYVQPDDNSTFDKLVSYGASVGIWAAVCQVKEEIVMSVLNASDEKLKRRFPSEDELRDAAMLLFPSPDTVMDALDAAGIISKY